ncbi:MAG TPA: alpha/beta hydrolase domain-containing protein, partial [Chthoniobacterales bacterium]
WKVGPGLRAIRLKGGFEPGKIYEVVYRAQDPAIAGLGFAAVRDFASYLKQPENELAPATKRVHALGISQSGRFLRHFLLEGFNADEAGQRAIDGMFIHVAGAGIGSFNHRFAQPSRDAQPTTALFYPTDLFPFTDAPQTEPETGKRAGLLDRYTRVVTAGGPADRERRPKIFHTNTSYEYWSRAGSLIHTSPDGKRDVPPDENARIYHLAGLQHFSRSFPPTPETEPSLAAQHLPNPNPVRWFWRALFVAMDDWVREGKEPPESRYPKIADGTLVRPAGVKFPALRGVKLPERVHEALRLDFGPQWKNRMITKQPPAVGKPFPSLVPQVDENGNDRGGVRLPQLEVPLATYTGWNLRDPKIGMANERVSFLGSFFPLPKTKADAEAAGDPREPIAERYPSREEYLRKFEEAAAELAAAGYLLEEDIEALVARGGEEWDFVTK